MTIDNTGRQLKGMWHCVVCLMLPSVRVVPLFSIVKGHGLCTGH